MSLRDTDYLDGARDFGGGERSVRALAAIDGGRNGTLLAMDSSTGNGIGVVRLDRRGDLTWRGDTLEADGTEKPFLLQHSFTDPAAPVPLTVGGDSWIFSSNQFYFDAGFLSKGYIDNGIHTFDLVLQLWMEVLIVGDGRRPWPDADVAIATRPRRRRGDGGRTGSAGRSSGAVPRW